VDRRTELNGTVKWEWLLSENADDDAGQPVADMRSRKKQTATSWTVAREAGVSQSTVSRALRGDPRVAEETRKKIDESARRLGYAAPRSDLQPASSRRSRTIGIVVSDLTNPFFPHQLQPLYDEFQLLDYRVVLFVERSDTPSGYEGLKRLLDRSVDGVLLTTGTLGSQIPSLVQEKGIPLVQLTRYIDDLDADRVVTDNRGGALAAARYVLGLGHRWIGMISGPGNTSTQRDRLLGMTEALEEVGLTLEPRFMKQGGFTHHAGYQFATELLSLPERPTVIFCANDVLAFGALDAAKALGVRVPADVSIVGFDDIPMAAWESFQLTTVNQPAAEMARSAARMLAERIESVEDIGPGRTRVFLANLVKRDTVTGPPSQ
jgi:LacI family transcriptional regulator